MQAALTLYFRTARFNPDVMMHLKRDRTRVFQTPSRLEMPSKNLMRTCRIQHLSNYHSETRALGDPNSHTRTCGTAHHKSKVVYFILL